MLIVEVVHWNGKDRGEVIVDNEDGWVRRYKWRFGNNGYVYRKTSRRINGVVVGVNLLMHREIMGCWNGDGWEVDHKNKDVWDNRRGNLQLVKKGEHRLLTARRMKHGKGLEEWVKA